MSAVLSHDPRMTALMLIDHKVGIVGMPLAPFNGRVVVERGADLPLRFAAAARP